MTIDPKNQLRVAFSTNHDDEIAEGVNEVLSEYEQDQGGENQSQTDEQS